MFEIFLEEGQKDATTEREPEEVEETEKEEESPKEESNQDRLKEGDEKGAEIDSKMIEEAGGSLFDLLEKVGNRVSFFCQV